MNGGCTISMYSGTSSTTAGTKRVVSRRPVMHARVLRPEHREHEAARGRDDDLREPAVRSRARPCSRSSGRRRKSDQAARRLLHAVPCGNSEIGWLIVSTVGVIADFASQSSGPRPNTTSAASRSTCAVPTPHLMRGRVQSARVSRAPPLFASPRGRRRNGRVIRCSTSAWPAGRRARTRQGRRRASS